MNEKLAQMRATVLEELDHIPKRPKPAQSDLRAVYWSKRMRTLGKRAQTKKSRHDVIRDCIEFLKEWYPDEKFDYDKPFFRSTGK